MPQLAITRLASGGVITNYDCVSRCGHCLYNCGPRRPKDYLGPGRALAIFQRIAELGCRSVHIGGGEPLRHPDKLLDVLEAARRVGVAIDYVETNSAWCTDVGDGVDILRRLKGAGVSTLLVSMSPFHNAHIPFLRVRNVIEACRRAGVTVFPWVNAFVRDLSRLDESRPHAMADFEAAFGSDYLKRIPDRYWIHLGGRALETFRPVYPRQSVDDLLGDSPRNCARALSDTNHFHIDLYGNYVPGLCAGLTVGMDDLGNPLPKGKYPLIDALAARGIRGLYDLAVRISGYGPQRAGYLNHCDLCTDIRRYLVGLEGKTFLELAPVGFYDELPQ